MENRKVIIGTWGMGGDFGGKPAEVDDLLNNCVGAGFDQFDTAMVYGDVEEKLGAFCGKTLKIATKIPSQGKPKLSEKHLDIRHFYPLDYFHRKIVECLSRYKNQKIDTLQLHNWHPDFDIEQIRGELECLRERGDVNRFGVSLPEGYIGDVPDFFDSIQIPYDVFSPEKIVVPPARGEYWARSIFRHGLVFRNGESSLIEGDKRRGKFEKMDDVDNYRKKRGILDNENLISCVIDDVNHDPRIAKIIVGVTKNEQVLQISKIVNIL